MSAIHGAQRRGPGAGAPLRVRGLRGRRQLTEAIPAPPPMPLLLLDEVEKAHPEVFNLCCRSRMTAGLTDSQDAPWTFRNQVW